MSKKLSVDELKALVDPSPEIRQLKQRLQLQASRIDELKLQLGEDQAFFDELSELVQEIEPVKIVYEEKAKKRVASPCSCVVHFTDWHIGEVIEANEVDDFNAYNLDIAKERMAAFVSKAMDIVSIQRASYTIPELVVLCTADFISGDIHDELKVTNEFPVPCQIVEAGSLLGSTIMSMAPHFERVRVEFIVPDNHSRLTKKIQFKQSGLNSYNYVVGFIANRLVSNQPNVAFNTYAAHQQVVQVQNMRYLCQHGHGIKGTWGIPFYGIERVASQAAKARINRPDSKKFHKLLIGHFHAPLRQSWWQVGGSLSGTSELDHANNRYSGPCQTLWFVHPKHGEFNYNELWLAQGSPLGVPGSGS